MAIGVVKWFNESKGYGCIEPNEGGESLFAHISEMDIGGLKTLKPGQLVCFEKTQGIKGMQASDIRVL
jgi:CspA family cold shock protein